MTNILAYLSLALTVIGFVLYVRSIIRKETKPHAFSWFIRGIVTGTWFFAQRTETDSIATWVLWFSCIATFSVGIYAWFRYQDVIKKIDRRFLAASLVWIVVWYITKTPFWSVIIISITDFLAFLPTFRKAYDDPYSEYLPLYGLAGLSNLFALMSIGIVTIAVWLYPLCLVVTNIWFVIFAMIRRMQMRK